MELRKNIKNIDAYKPEFTDPNKYFEAARTFAETFYSDDINRIRSVRFERVKPRLFFMEYIWVVYATGFSAQAVSKFINKLFDAFQDWGNIHHESFDDVYERVKPICKNKAKAKAVYDTADIVLYGIELFGWEQFKNKYLSTPERLQDFPYIGKVTCFHLARNIGLLDFMKPDLHLVRMADHWEFFDPTEMCKSMQPDGMPLGVVDYMLWVTAATFGTLEIRKENSR